MTTPTNPSQARVDANRRNALKSTGPRTPEGKARSSRNATKHGLTAQTRTPVAGENPDEMAAHLDRWKTELGAGGVVEEALIELAGMSSWKLKRAAVSEAAAVATNVRHAATEFDLAQKSRAYELGAKLLSDPVCRTAAVKRDPEFTAQVHAWLAVEPALLVAELESFEAGVAWMLREWRGLAGILKREGYWHFPEKHAAIRLLGKRFENVLNDPVVTELFLACNVAHVGAWTFFNECIQVTLYANTKPPFFKRVNELELNKPKDKESARAVLWTYVKREVRRLKRLRERLKVEAEFDRRQAEQKALFDAGPDAALRLRYESANQRTLIKALSELAQHRKTGILVGTPKADTPAPAPEPKAAARTTTRRKPAVTEPLPQVAEHLEVAEIRSPRRRAGETLRNEPNGPPAFPFQFRVPEPRTGPRNPEFDDMR